MWSAAGSGGIMSPEERVEVWAREQAELDGRAGDAGYVRMLTRSMQGRGMALDFALRDLGRVLSSALRLPQIVEWLNRKLTR